MKRIVFFGDSIMFGQRVSIGDIFVVKLAQSLPDAIITNLSTCGDTTRMALNRMAFDIQPQSFDIMIMQFGFNDSNYWITDNRLPRISKDSFRANLNEIIDRAYNRNISKVFMCTNHHTTRTDNFPNLLISLYESNKQYNEIIREVAEDRGLFLFDIEKYFSDKDLSDLLLPDGTHLSLSGHKLYFNIIYPILEKEINDINY